MNVQGQGRRSEVQHSHRPVQSRSPAYFWHTQTHTLAHTWWRLSWRGLLLQPLFNIPGSGGRSCEDTVWHQGQCWRQCQLSAVKDRFHDDHQVRLRCRNMVVSNQKTGTKSGHKPKFINSQAMRYPIRRQGQYQNRGQGQHQPDSEVQEHKA